MISTRARCACNAIQATYAQFAKETGGFVPIVDGDSIPGFVVIAGVEHEGGPSLRILTAAQAIRWFESALSLQQCDSDFSADFAAAMLEADQDHWQITVRPPSADR